MRRPATPAVRALSCLLVSIGLWAAPAELGSRARACSRSACPEDFLVWPAAGVVPANVPAVRFEVEYLPDELVAELEAGVRLVTVDAVQTDVSTTLVPDPSVISPARGYLLRLEEELVPDTEYRVEALGCEPMFVEDLTTTVPEAVQRTLAVFRAGPPQELPAGMPKLQATASVRQDIRVAGGSACVFDMNAAVVEVSVTPTESLDAWRDVLLYSVYVDGELWTDLTIDGGSDGGTMEPATGLGATRIYQQCDAESQGLYPGPGEGRHHVEFSVRVPGQDQVLRSKPLTIELRCHADAGCHAAGHADGAREWSNVAWPIAALVLGWRVRRQRHRRHR